MSMPFDSATRYAARVGQFFGVVMLLVGSVWNWTLAFIGLMVFVVCTIELIKLGITKVTFQMGQPQTPYRSSSETEDIIDAVDVRRVR